MYIKMLNKISNIGSQKAAAEAGPSKNQPIDEKHDAGASKAKTDKDVLIQDDKYNKVSPVEQLPIAKLQPAQERLPESATLRQTLPPLKVPLKMPTIVSNDNIQMGQQVREELKEKEAANL